MAYKPIKLATAAAPSLSQVRIENFLGVDFTNQPSNVDERRSPEAPNMIRDVPGKVRKRMGWHTLHRLGGRVNGFHPLYQKDPVLHAGNTLYRLPGGMRHLGGKEEEQGPVALYSEAADSRSKSWEFEGRSYIADGQALLVYDGETVQKASETARVPLVTIAKAPTGGGTQYEDLNLLQPKFTEQFLGTAGDKTYQLSFGGLDEAAVEVQQLQADGSWAEKTEGTHFSVDRAAGRVTFVSAPGESPVSGQDNVKITASRTVEGYAERINRCRFGIQFGVNGAADRLFLAGNPEFIHYDWYSGQNDPGYWADTAYSVLGQSDSAIVGYSIVNARLAAHKNATDSERNVIVREGNLVESQPSFPIVNMLQGEGAVAPYSFAYLSTEPLFLTKLGLFAITTADITGDKYAQQRSFYLNGKLLAEPNLEDAFATVYRDMYWLCLNGAAYILDGLQPTGTDRQAPYSTRQYAGFYCTNIPARVLWQEEGALYFGSEDGAVRAFYTDPQTLTSYADDGEPVYACWRTPDLQGRSFYRSKTFSRVYVELASAVATSLRVLGRVDGIWEELFLDDTSARYFDWGRIDWSKWSWSCDDTPRTLGEKVRIKKVDKAGYKVENGQVNEPFGLENICIEFVETGYYK